MSPVIVQEHKRVTINATGCAFDFHSRRLNILFFISRLSCQRDVKFRHSTRNVSRIRRKVKGEVS